MKTNVESLRYSLYVSQERVLIINNLYKDYFLEINRVTCDTFLKPFTEIKKDLCKSKPMFFYCIFGAVEIKKI